MKRKAEEKAKAVKLSTLIKEGYVQIGQIYQYKPFAHNPLYDGIITNSGNIQSKNSLFTFPVSPSLYCKKIQETYGESISKPSISGFHKGLVDGKSLQDIIDNYRISKGLRPSKKAREKQYMPRDDSDVEPTEKSDDEIDNETNDNDRRDSALIDLTNTVRESSESVRRDISNIHAKVEIMSNSQIIVTSEMERLAKEVQDLKQLQVVNHELQLEIDYLRDVSVKKSEECAKTKEKYIHLRAKKTFRPATTLATEHYDNKGKETDEVKQRHNDEFCRNVIKMADRDQKSILPRKRLDVLFLDGSRGGTYNIFNTMIKQNKRADIRRVLCVHVPNHTTSAEELEKVQTALTDEDVKLLVVRKKLEGLLAESYMDTDVKQLIGTWIDSTSCITTVTSLIEAYLNNQKKIAYESVFAITWVRSREKGVVNNVDEDMKSIRQLFKEKGFTYRDHERYKPDVYGKKKNMRFYITTLINDENP